jgi:hypothetical protein
MRISFCLWCTLLVIFAFGLASGQDTDFATGPQYLMNSGSSLFARPISTPTMSIPSTPPQVGADNTTGVLVAGAENQTVLPPLAVALPPLNLFPIFYGEREEGVIEISLPSESTEPSIAAILSPSILDTGVEQIATAEALRDRGYGIPLAEAASRVKAHSHPAGHIYTNADIYRLQGAK